jgi:hypothetical protein
MVVEHRTVCPADNSWRGQPGKLLGPRANNVSFESQGLSLEGTAVTLRFQPEVKELVVEYLRNAQARKAARYYRYMSKEKRMDRKG